MLLKIREVWMKPIEAYTKAISLKPENAVAYNNMGNALKERGNLEEAVGPYTKAISQAENAVAYNNMGIFFKIKVIWTRR